MSKYDHLRAAYKAWHERGVAHERAAQAFARFFADQLRIYVGAPETFRDFSNENEPSVRRYVEAFAGIEREDGMVEKAKSESRFRAASHQEDGRWLTLIALILEIDPNTWPKMPWAFSMWFRLQGNECRLWLGGKNGQLFIVQTDDPQTLVPAFEFILSKIDRWLSHEPWESPEETQLGFLPPIGTGGPAA